MTIAQFPAQDPSEQVALTVVPGSPDVLSLLTTNIPQVHACLVELRQRPDHPQNRPREIWIDLSACRNFPETRGEVLVRALRLTQFLPCGFIGTDSPVIDMSRATHLPRVDTRDHLPRVAASPSTVSSPQTETLSRVEHEQQEDIVADLTRRLRGLQEENASQTQRANVLSEALGVVRGNRDQLEGEVQELRTQLGRLNGELEWSTVKQSGAEGEVAALAERLSKATADFEDARARAEALEGGMQLVEAALMESRREACLLQLRIQEMEDSNASQEQIQELSAALAHANQRSDDLSLQIAANELNFSTQRAQFIAERETLVTKVGELTSSLAISHQELLQHRDNMAALVAARDAVEQQSSLTTQMMEDALAQVEVLANQASDLGEQVQHYQARCATLSEDSARAHEQLLVAQKEANQANLDLVSASNLARARAQQIAQFTADNHDRDAALESAQQDVLALKEALDQARARVVETQSSLDHAHHEVDQAQASLSDMRSTLSSKEQLLVEALSGKAQALDRCRELEARFTNEQMKVASLEQQIEGVVLELSQAQSALVEAIDELTQVQRLLDETRRANGVLNELARRNGQEIASINAEVDTLTNRLAASNEQLNAARQSLDAAAEREQASLAQSLHRATLAEAQAESLSRRLATAVEEASTAATQTQFIIEGLRSDLARQEASNEEINQVLATSRRELSESRDQVQSLSASIVRMQGQLTVLQGELHSSREEIAVREGTIVEQQGQIHRLTAEAESARLQSDGLREQALALDTTIQRQQEQIERTRQSMAHSSVALTQEQQAHSATRIECENIAREAARLSAVTEEQGVEIDALSTEMIRVRALCEEKSIQLVAAEGTVAEVERAARNDRRQRASLEVELVDVQEKCASLQAARKAFDIPVQRQETVAPVMSKPTVHHRDRVRSGQVVTSEGDLVVMKAVSSGAELRAVGSVHIYGAMNGRVHAGCQGDTTARIWCSHFAAEQVAIAGKVFNFERVPANLIGHSVEIWLDGSNITVRPTDME